MFRGWTTENSIQRRLKSHWKYYYTRIGILVQGSFQRSSVSRFEFVSETQFWSTLFLFEMRTKIAISNNLIVDQNCNCTRDLNHRANSDRNTLFLFESSDKVSSCNFVPLANCSKRQFLPVRTAVGTLVANKFGSLKLKSTEHLVTLSGHFI